MNVLHGFDDPAACRGGFVSIGNFDGVHRGHQRMVAALVRHARSAGVPAVVFTFDPHPIRILRPEKAPPNLMMTDQKVELLAALGVDCVIVYPTDRALLNLTPEEFFERIIRRELDAHGLVEGPNFFFGRNRAGDISTLTSLCETSGLTLDVVEPVVIERRMVSSSEVRSLISAGTIAGAVELLGHPYVVRGTVNHGADRGRALGFPTANLAGVETLLPPDGVYAGIAHADGKSYPAAVHLGPNLTFGERDRKLEVHLIGFSGDLYGRRLDVDLLDRVRDTRAFDSVEELKKQMESDLRSVEAVVQRFRASRA